MKRLLGVGAALLLVAGVAQAAYIGAININVSRGDADGPVGANPAGQAVAFGSGMWDNLTGDASGLLDANGNATTASIVLPYGGGDNDFLHQAGSYGVAGPGGAPNTIMNAGTVNTTTTISSIPWTTYDVVVYWGWFENSPGGNYSDPATFAWGGGPYTIHNNDFGDLMTVTMGSTITLASQNGGSLRGIQILGLTGGSGPGPGGDVPEPGTWLLLGGSLLGMLVGVRKIRK